MHKLLLTLPFLLGPALLAQQPRITGGARVGLSLPAGDFADQRNGYGDYVGANDGLGFQVGGHLNIEFDRHNQIRLYATAMGFAGQEHDIYTNGSYDGTRQNTFGVLQVGAEYLYHFQSPSRGGYLLGGLSLNRVNATYTYSHYSDVNVSQSGRAGFRLGGGYHFNRVFSLEGSLNNVSVDNYGSNGLGFSALTWVSLDAVLRFGSR